MKREQKGVSRQTRGRRPQMPQKNAYGQEREGVGVGLFSFRLGLQKRK